MRKKKQTNKTTEFAVYKGEEFIFVGTIDEIVEHTGYKRSTIEFMTHPVAKKRNKGNGIALYRIEEDEEDG